MPANFSFIFLQNGDSQTHFGSIDMKRFNINETWSERFPSEEENWCSFDSFLFLYIRKFIKNGFLSFWTSKTMNIKLCIIQLTSSLIPNETFTTEASLFRNASIELWLRWQHATSDSLPTVGSKNVIVLWRNTEGFHFFSGLINLIFSWS